MEDFRLRFVPLGGVVGVTKNMYLYELYKGRKLEDILIVDCGIGFPDSELENINYIIPDISYLLEKDPTSPNGLRRASKIRAIILSHGHEDHTMAMPYHYRDLREPQVYTGKLTTAFVKNDFKEFGLNIKINEIDLYKTYTFGNFKVNFIRMTHSIPDTLHIFINTPVGNIYHGTDFKLDLTPPYGNPPDFHTISTLSSKGVLCLMSDCLGAETPGLTLSESAVGESFDTEIKNTTGKFIMTTFSSNISRIRQCIEMSIKYQRKTVFLGRSMRENTEIAKQIGYLPFKTNMFTDERSVRKAPPKKITLIVAGSQGQTNSALNKLATDQNRNIKIGKGDKVVFSSDPIPGNEAEVYKLIEKLMIKGADVVYPDVKDRLHASGHGNQEDLKFLMCLVSAKNLIPIGGTIRHQRQYLKLAKQLSYPEQDVFLLNEGDSVWIDKDKMRTSEKIKTKNIYVSNQGLVSDKIALT
ncbi:MAG: ribonuclease J [bacterium]